VNVIRRDVTELDIASRDERDDAVDERARLSGSRPRFDEEAHIMGISDAVPCPDITRGRHSSPSGPSPDSSSGWRRRKGSIASSNDCRSHAEPRSSGQSRSYGAVQAVPERLASHADVKVAITR